MCKKIKRFEEVRRVLVRTWTLHSWKHCGDHSKKYYTRVKFLAGKKVFLLARNLTRVKKLTFTRVRFDACKKVILPASDFSRVFWVQKTPFVCRKCVL